MRQLQHFFDRIYVINCPHRRRRMSAFWKESLTAGVVDPRCVSRVDGIIGALTSPPEPWSKSPGAWGCMRSHVRLLEDLLVDVDQVGGYRWERALILEDDAYFLGSAMERLGEFMDALPDDWDQIYLGGQNRKTPLDIGNPHVKRGVSVNRTHAYAVSTRALPTIYRHVSDLAAYAPGRHIDHRLEEAHIAQLWNTYVPAGPWICGQLAGTSDVSGQTTPQLHWNKP